MNYCGRVTVALAGWPLIGRDEELSIVDEEIGVRAGSIVIAGTVGVGKSRLMTASLDQLRERGRAIVLVRATPSTATVPFGAFASWVPHQLGTDDRLAVLQAVARRLLGENDPDTPAASAAPVVAIDDAQFLDDGSAALVWHLAQRTPASLVLTARSGEPCPETVTALWKEALAVRLEVQPLAEAETARLVEGALGAPVAATTQNRLWRLTEGNPLYLREVVHAAREQGVLAPVGGVWRWKGALESSSRLVELVASRVGREGSGERRVLELVALGEPLEVDVLAHLAPQDLLVEVEARGLLAVGEPGVGDVVRLAHPLYSEVLRSRLPLVTAQRHRADLAAAAIATGAHRQDPVRVATWLLECGVPPSEPDLLLEASIRAQIVDDYEMGARLAEASVRAGGGWRAAIWQVDALGPLHRHDVADALLDSLAVNEDDPEAHAAAARLRAQHLFWYRNQDAAVALDSVVEAARRIPAPARSSLLSYGARLALFGLELERATELATQAAADADTLIDRLHAVTIAGFAAAFLGRTRAALATVDMVGQHVFTVIETDPVPAGGAAWTYSLAMVPAGRIDEAAAFFEAILQQDFVRLGGSYRALPALWLARMALEQGRLRTAADLSREALAILGDANYFGRGDWLAVTWATAAAQAGDIEQAADAMAWIEAHGKPEVKTFGLYLELARSWLSAARGETSQALRLALGAAERARQAGAHMIEMVALLDATRLGAGEGVAGPAAAAGIAARLEALTSLVEGPYARAVARFADAVVTGDGGSLDDAAARFEAMGARLHAAEAGVCAAAAHHQAGLRRNRAVSLRRARVLADQCEGAVTPLVARLAQEPTAADLTRREREIAELAARGFSNREIADKLQVSMRTVNSHLNHAYTKLGTNDRSELPALLGRRGVGHEV